MRLGWTNAPADYDYSYVETGLELPTNPPSRIIRIYDEGRFLEYQQPRYASGLHQSFLLWAADGKDSEAMTDIANTIDGKRSSDATLEDVIRIVRRTDREVAESR